MKRVITLLLFLALITTSTLDAHDITGKCVGVMDGDTIQILVSDQPVKIRLEGIDCPEKNQDFGQKAKQFTSFLVFGKKIIVKVKCKDKYGRSVGRVILDGKDISIELMRAGLAWHYTKYSNDPVLAEAERTARLQRIGIWSATNPIPPWEFRRKYKNNRR